MAAACASVAPWFVHEHRVFGAAFWTQIFGKQVLQRFTSYLDPNHLRPWWFYVGEISRVEFGTAYDMALADVADNDRSETG